MTGEKVRKRSETFADHYSQARQFFRSQTETEQQHIINAFAFELAKVETKAIRTRMLGHLAIVDPKLHDGVANALGMKETDEIKPAIAPRDLAPSPALSILAKKPDTLAGRKIGGPMADGFDSAQLASLRAGAKAEKAVIALIAPKVGGAKDSAGKLVEAEMALSGAPSVLFDTVVILGSKDSATELASNAAAIDFVRDAFGHCKVIAHSADARALLDAAGVKPDNGVIEISKGADAFINTAKGGRIWSREPGVRPPG